MKIRVTIALFFASTAYYGTSQPTNIDSLYQIIAIGNKDRNEARALNELADEYSRKDFQKAREYLADAVKICIAISNDVTLSSSYSQLVYLFHETGKPDSAEYYLKKIKNLALTSNRQDRDFIYQNYYSVAALYLKKTGKFKKAIPFFEQAISLCLRTNNKITAAGQLLNVGNTYQEIGNYQQATLNHLRALRLFEEVNSDRGKSFCYQGLSNSFTEMAQYNQALLYANKSIDLKTTQNDHRGLGTAQSGLGDIYMGLKNYDQALLHYNKAITIAKEIKLISEEQKINFSIAKLYAAKKEINPAVRYLEESKILAKQVGDSTAIVAIDAEEIALRSNTVQMEQSEKKLLTSVQMVEQQGSASKKVMVFKNMADFYTANKQFEKALEYTHKYYAVSDSIKSNEVQLQVRQMEEQYNIEKKEKEIAILKKNQLLSQTSMQKQKFFQYVASLLMILLVLITALVLNRFRLRQRMKELELRNRIAADLHDEVGSSLSSIHMLSQIAEGKETNAYSKDILHRMSSNARETMEKMSDIVWMVKPDENDGQSLKTRMERFVYPVCDSKEVECSFTGNALDHLRLTMQQRKNVYLIFKEAVNNAIKCSGTKKLDIYIAVQSNQLQMQIKDYGTGFNETNIVKGNGLDNMHTRAKELKGCLQIISKHENGTQIHLQVPLKN